MDDIARLHAAGLTYKEMAEHLGVSITTIYNELTRAGLVGKRAKFEYRSKYPQLRDPEYLAERLREIPKWQLAVEIGCSVARLDQALCAFPGLGVEAAADRMDARMAKTAERAKAERAVIAAREDDRRKAREERAVAVRRRLEAGESLTSIASDFGLSISGMSRWCARNGIKVPSGTRAL